VRESLAVFQKDLRSEFRTRYALNTIFLFALVTLMAASFAVGSSALSQAPSPAEEAALHERLLGQVTSEVRASLLWVIVFFAAMSGLARVFIREEETRTVNALKLAATANVVYVGKFVFNLLLLLLLETFVVPLFAALLHVQGGNLGLLIGVLILGSLGLTAVATLVAAIVAQASAKGALFAVLSFPVLVPLLMTTMKGTATALRGGSLTEALPELQFLLSYTVIMTVLALFLFPLVWEG